MDFITLLRRDHERVASLFKQIQGGFEQPDTPERHRLFRQLKRELDIHAAVEDLHICISIESFSRKRPHATRHTTP